MIGLTFAALATAATASSPKGPPPSSVPSLSQQCMQAEDPDPAKANLHPIAVWFVPDPKAPKDGTVSVCMAGQKHERGVVYVQGVVIELRGHAWGEGGQAACLFKLGDPNYDQEFRRPQCHESRFLSEFHVDRFWGELQPPADRIVVTVSWTDCTGTAAGECPGSPHREFYFVQTASPKK